MTRKEAKYILNGYPVWGGSDDAEFNEALALAQHDPELGEWHAREQSLDAMIAGKLQTVAPPPDLQAQALAAPKGIRFRNWKIRLPLWGAAAAIVAFIATLYWTGVTRHGKPVLNDFRAFVVNAAATLDHLDLQTKDASAIHEWLNNAHAPSEFSAPSNLAARPRVGCRVFDWQKQRVSLVCFEVGNQKVAHMFVIERSALAKLPGSGLPTFQTDASGISTAAWNDDRNVYMVAIRNGERELKSVVGGWIHG
jgi:hypothetical protein